MASSVLVKCRRPHTEQAALNDQGDRDRCTPAGGDLGKELRDCQTCGGEGQRGTDPGEEGPLIGKAEPIVGPASYALYRPRISHRPP
jgi:hypothetical protein